MNNSHYPTLVLCEKLGKIGFPLGEKRWCTKLGDQYEPIVMEGTLPNAIAEMIIWLAENKHLTFSKDD